MIFREVGELYILCDKMFVSFEVVNATLLQYRYKRLYLAKIKLMKISKALPLTILAVGLYSCEPNEPVDPNERSYHDLERRTSRSQFNSNVVFSRS